MKERREGEQMEGGKQGRKYDYFMIVTMKYVLSVAFIAKRNNNIIKEEKEMSL